MRHFIQQCASTTNSKILFLRMSKLVLVIGAITVDLNIFMNLRLWRFLVTLHGPAYRKKMSLFCPICYFELFCTNPRWVVMRFCFLNCPNILWMKIGFSDWEKLLNFLAESQKFATFLRSKESFIQTVKGQNNFWNRMLV